MPKERRSSPVKINTRSMVIKVAIILQLIALTILRLRCSFMLPPFRLFNTGLAGFEPAIFCLEGSCSVQAELQPHGWNSFMIVYKVY